MRKTVVFLVISLLLCSNFIFSQEIKLAKISKKSYYNESNLNTILKRYKHRKYSYGSYKKKYIFSKRFLKPLNGYIYKDSKHKGIYIKPYRYDKGVKAAKSGKVIFADFLKYFGNVIIIQHKNGYSTIYAYLKKLYVKKGNYVKKGSLIANFYKKHPIYFEIKKNYRSISRLAKYKRLLYNG